MLFISFNYCVFFNFLTNLIVILLVKLYLHQFFQEFSINQQIPIFLIFNFN